MVLAVLELIAASSLSGHDVYLNVAGGLRIQEPAADLAAAAALVSSLANAPLPVDAGISGNLAVRRGAAESRNPPREGSRQLGFARAVLPETARGDAGAGDVD